jgi:hypothetical protein
LCFSHTISERSLFYYQFTFECSVAAAAAVVVVVVVVVAAAAAAAAAAAVEQLHYSYNILSFPFYAS